MKYANRAKNIKTTAWRNVKHVQHHITEYTKIISDLKDEISGLKLRLSYENAPKQLMIKQSGESDLEGEDDERDDLLQTDRQLAIAQPDESEKLEHFLENLANHFVEETKLVKRVDELQNKHSLCKLSTVNTKILLEQAKQRYGGDHDQCKNVQKELEILNKNDLEFQDKTKYALQAITDIKSKRDELKFEWENSDVTTQAKRLLNLQFTQHCSIVDKITLELDKNDDSDWIVKMDQLREMDEQILIRDKLIKLAGTKLKKYNLSSLFNNSLLVKDPYGICINELSDKESYGKERISLSKNTNNSLPQLNTYKQ